VLPLGGGPSVRFHLNPMRLPCAQVDFAWQCKGGASTRQEPCKSESTGELVGVRVGVRSPPRRKFSLIMWWTPPPPFFIERNSLSVLGVALSCSAPTARRCMLRAYFSCGDHGLGWITATAAVLRGIHGEHRPSPQPQGAPLPIVAGNALPHRPPKVHPRPRWGRHVS
jgi:hypothetical protein